MSPTHGEEKEDENDLLHRLSYFIDQNIRIVNNTIWLCGGIGLCIIMYSIRIHKRFTHFSQVPEEFIRKHVKLRGQVKSVHNNHLLVQHKPIVSFKKLKDPKPLMIHLAGVEYNREGVRFLEQHSLNKEVWFRLMQVKNHEGIECIVSLRKSMLKVWNLNEEILRQGYGKVVPLAQYQNSKFTTKLMQQLLQAELYAEKKKKGVWKEVASPRQNVILFLKNTFHKITNIFKRESSKR